jgi:NAD-dependent DNA ligase
MQEGRRRRVETLARALSKLPTGQIEQLDTAADIIERVVAGDEAGSKLDKARELEVEVLDQAALEALLGASDAES